MADISASTGAVAGHTAANTSFKKQLNKVYGFYTGGFLAFVIVLAILEQHRDDRIHRRQEAAHERPVGMDPVLLPHDVGLVGHQARPLAPLQQVQQVGERPGKLVVHHDRPFHVLAEPRQRGQRNGVGGDLGRDRRDEHRLGGALRGTEHPRVANWRAGHRAGVPRSPSGASARRHRRTASAPRAARRRSRPSSTRRCASRARAPGTRD